MAFIQYPSDDAVPLEDQVNDPDNILQIHRIHSKVMRMHYDLYLELMHRPGPLSRMQREMLGVQVSLLNECHY